jgi:hypothetical protein
MHTLIPFGVVASSIGDQNRSCLKRLGVQDCAPPAIQNNFGFGKGFTKLSDIAKRWTGRTQTDQQQMNRKQQYSLVAHASTGRSLFKISSLHDAIADNRSSEKS